MAIVNATSTLKIVRVVITRHHVTSIMTIIMIHQLDYDRSVADVMVCS